MVPQKGYLFNTKFISNSLITRVFLCIACCNCLVNLPYIDGDIVCWIISILNIVRGRLVGTCVWWWARLCLALLLTPRVWPTLLITRDNIQPRTRLPHYEPWGQKRSSIFSAIVRCRVLLYLIDQVAELRVSPPKHALWPANLHPTALYGPLEKQAATNKPHHPQSPHCQETKR